MGGRYGERLWLNGRNGSSIPTGCFWPGLAPAAADLNGRSRCTGASQGRKLDGADSMTAYGSELWLNVGYGEKF